MPLWPPKPKLLDSVGPGVQGRASPRTRSISGSSGSTAVVTAVGGIRLAAHRLDDGDRLDGTGRAERVAGDALDRRDGRAGGAEQLGHRLRLGGVVERGGGAVGVHVGDVGRR